MKNFAQLLGLFVLFAFIAAPFNAYAQSIEEGEDVFIVYDTDAPENLETWDNEESFQPQLVATPNPAINGNLKVFYNKVHNQSQLSLINMNGQVMRHTQVGEDYRSYGSHSFSTAGLSPGTYFLRLQNELYQTITKIIIL